MAARGSSAGVLPWRSYLLGRLVLGLGVVLVLQPMGASPEAALLVLSVLAVTSLLGAQVSRRPAADTFPVAGILVSDVLLETYVILQTGAYHSPFVILYGFTVLCAGLMLALAGGVAFGALSAAASLGLAWLLPLSSVAGRAEPWWPLPVTRLALQGLFFVALGVAGGSLAALMRRRHRQWEETSRRLAQSEMEAETILNHLPWGVVTLDYDGRIRHLNPAARSLLESAGQVPPAAGEDVASTLESAGAGELAALARRTLETRRGSGCHELSLRSGINGGTDRPVEVVTAPIGGPGGDLRGVVLLFQDLSERKRLEAQARRQDRLAALGRFSAGLAHEIRNSLKPISGSAELMAACDLPQDAYPLIDLIVRESEALERFLESYLDYARDKDLQISRVDIDGLIQEEMESLRHHPRWREPVQWDVQLRRCSGVCISADRDQLRRALRNLMLNALEATAAASASPEGSDSSGRNRSSPGRVRITLELRGQATCRLRLRDWGCGMTRETLENLFTPLFTTKADGTGLGLCYARRVAERHNGRFTITSCAGKGTLATLDLPCKPALARAA
ncbi:MAG: PAS domain-containing protein [Candidatus Eisenbacteria bacterium]|nr:PAS domain-containing protein [Candidatus Eisenbacteria bacterium]